MSLLSVVPKLVSDVNLKRARVETEEGDAIRVTGINCGDRVTIVPTLSEGTKIADYTINNVDGELYAPKGGVGETYPGSTGGEIFNCYEGENRNIASGTHSKASGEKNQALGDITVVGGAENIANHYGEAIFGINNVGRAAGTFIAGLNNSVNDTVGEFDGSSIILGEDNTKVNGCVIGKANGIGGNATYKAGYLFGKNLSYYNSKDDTYNSPDTIVIGNYNTKTTLIHPSVVLASGTGGSRFNGLELSKTDCKILTDLQLSTDTTAVNAITPPQDPNNVTSDDKTLVTVSHLNNSGLMKQEQHRLTVQPDLRYGGGRNITTDLGLTVPDWATEVILRIRIVDANNFDSSMTRRYSITIPVQPSDLTDTWRGNLNIALPRLYNSIWTVVYYSGEFAIYQNVLSLEHAVDVKVVQGTPPTITVNDSTTSFFLEGMDFKGIL